MCTTCDIQVCHNVKAKCITFHRYLHVYTVLYSVNNDSCHRLIFNKHYPEVHLTEFDSGHCVFICKFVISILYFELNQFKTKLGHTTLSDILRNCTVILAICCMKA